MFNANIYKFYFSILYVNLFYYIYIYKFNNLEFLYIIFNYRNSYINNYI